MLGYFIGENTSLQKLIITYLPPLRDNGVEAFREGVGRNKSIRSISFDDCDRSDGHIFKSFDQFFKNTENLTEIEVSNCGLWAEDVRQFSLALRGCKKSLKQIYLSDNEIEEGQLLEIIQALNMHPHLEVLALNHMNIGRRECTALTGAISECQLVELFLTGNPTITIRGWERLSTLLEMPDSNLETLYMSSNNVGDEGALIFANALKRNCKLKTLALNDNDITAEGWAIFSKLLCDTTNMNNTYLSNHTLESLGGTLLDRIPADLVSYLALNARSDNKGQVAMEKILQHHSHFNVQPFFEWEFKVLPLMISWLEKADACTTTFDEKIDRIKLSCMYDFVREFPLLYVEPVTRKEIEEYSAMEEQLQEDEKMQHASQLEEVRQRKTRAMRRLL